MSDHLTPSFTLTKLQRPLVGRGLVARPRLLERLNASQNLTLVLAPAGYGKTTLLSTWLETSDRPHAWLSLDEHDDDLAIVVTYLVEALHTVFPAAASNTLALVNSVALPPAKELARQLLNDLAAIQQDFILVLDDYHFIHQRAIHELITELVQHPPRTLHLVIASRYDPSLPLAGLRARGHVVELRAADLHFTLEEAARLVHEVLAADVDERTIALLVARTEGWPAGLQLAALSLRRQRLTGPLAANASSDNRYIMDYLVVEVLAQLPISVQEFLIKTSILDQLCSPLCEAVTGMTDRLFNGQSILEWLERSDLFLLPVDHQQRWYRYHHLFRQLLFHRLEQLHGQAEIAALHLQASAWFAGNGYLDEALQHALTAGDVAAAAQLVAQHRHELMNQGQWQRLDRWVRLFPREVIDEQPDLLLFEVWMKFIQQQLGEVAALLDRVEALLPRLLPDAAECLQGEVDSRRSALLYWSGDWARSMTAAQQALKKVPLEWWYIRSYARLFLGVDYLMSGDLAQAYATLYATGEPDQGQGYQNFLLGAACFIHWSAADLAGMAQAARQVVAGSEPSDRAEIVTLSQYHLGLYYYERNNLSAAEKYLLPLVMQPYGLHANCFLNSAILLARIRQAQGYPEEALEIADLIASFALETRSKVVLLGARAFQAELALCQGHIAAASQWAAQFGSFRRMPTPLAFVPPLVSARILLAQNTAASRQQASQLLAEMSDYFTSIHDTSVQIRVLALQAVLYHLEGDEQQALAALEKSITLAEPGGFIRFYLDLGTPLEPLLMKLARRGVAPLYLTEILAAFTAQETQQLAGRQETTAHAVTPHRSELLTNREREVLLLLEKRYTDKEIAEALVISPKTVSSHIEHLGNKLSARGRRAIVEAAKDQGQLA